MSSKNEIALKEAQLNQALAAAAAGPTNELPRADETLRGESVPEVDTVCMMLPELPRAQVLHIWKKTFQPRNLCLLRLNYGLTEEANDTLDVSGSSILIKRATAALKDFGGSPAIWSKGILNYSMVLSTFYGREHPGLQSAILGFHSEVIKLADTYKWQEGVLPLALRWHEEAIVRGITTIENWRIPVQWQLQFLPPAMAKGFSVGKAPAGPSASRPSPTTTVCLNYNTAGKGCAYNGCRRRHVCSQCDKANPAFEHQ
jgi:hypothetical protein